jgi:hypothetical protein
LVVWLIYVPEMKKTALFERFFYGWVICDPPIRLLARRPPQGGLGGYADQ